MTRVPREAIVELARSIAGSKAALLMYTGLEYSNCGVQSIRAALCLWAITGNWMRLAVWYSGPAARRGSLGSSWTRPKR